MLLLVDSFLACQYLFDDTCLWHFVHPLLSSAENKVCMKLLIVLF